MKTKSQNNIAEIKISYSAKIKKQYRLVIEDSQDSYNSFLHSWDKDLIELQEEFKVMLLNRANQVLYQFAFKHAVFWAFPHARGVGPGFPLYLFVAPKAMGLQKGCRCNP